MPSCLCLLGAASLAGTAAAIPTCMICLTRRIGATKLCCSIVGAVCHSYSCSSCCYSSGSLAVPKAGKQISGQANDDCVEDLALTNKRSCSSLKKSPPLARDAPCCKVIKKGDIALMCRQCHPSCHPEWGIGCSWMLFSLSGARAMSSRSLHSLPGLFIAIFRKILCHQCPVKQLITMRKGGRLRLHRRGLAGPQHRQAEARWVLLCRSRS